MHYQGLGATGVQVSVQCLGTMMFGRIGNRDHDDCAAIISRAIQADINFVDTTDVYSRGESEEIVGRAIKGHRDEVVLAAKVFNPMGKDRNQRGGSRRWIMRAVEDSLRRLGTDYIHLYQAHRHDWSTDLDETLGALTDLVQQGKVRYLGSSSFPAAWIVEAQWAAERRQRARFVAGARVRAGASRDNLNDHRSEDPSSTMRLPPPRSGWSRPHWTPSTRSSRQTRMRTASTTPPGIRRCDWNTAGALLATLDAGQTTRY